MRTSLPGIKAIEGYEGCKLAAYPDPATGGAPWTIGVGHTGPDIHEGMTCTQEQAEEWLAKDLESAERAVTSAVKVLITQSQFDALVSFVFNVGAGAFASSSLLRLLNEGDYRGAAAQFDRWNKGPNGPMPGLTKRRAAERKMFESGIA